MNFSPVVEPLIFADMSAAKKKKRVVTTKKTVTPTRKRSSSKRVEPGEEFIFERENYLWMAGGLLLIALGFILMSGGSMPSPEVWDEGLIYSFRRTVVAPIVLLLGLGIEIYAILKK